MKNVAQKSKLTIGEVYNPLIEIAEEGNIKKANIAIRRVGSMIKKHNPTRCFTLEDGILAAKRNLDYYCQYFSEKTALKVKKIYGLGTGFRDLFGNKYL